MDGINTTNIVTIPDGVVAPSRSLRNAKVSRLGWLPEFNLGHFDENALTGAHLCCFDDRAFQSRAHHGETAGASRVIQYLTGLDHICNAVIEQREHIRCVIDA